MLALIIANGEIPPRTLLPENCDILIAADGGARHAVDLGLIPDVVVGDFDSLTSVEVAKFKAAGSLLETYPVNKDETDLELALNLARNRGCTQVVLLGLFGGRLDMTFSNLLLLAQPAYSGMALEARHGRTRVYIYHGGNELEIRGRPGDLVSVVPLSPTISGVTYTGLAWPLENATLRFGSPRGVSNQISHQRAGISIKKGTLAVFHHHNQGSNP